MPKREKTPQKNLQATAAVSLAGSPGNTAFAAEEYGMKQDKSIYYISVYSRVIEGIGYNPQCALLEVRLRGGRQVLQYVGVPEDVWYGFREDLHPDAYYRRQICGRYPERRIADRGRGSELR